MPSFDLPPNVILERSSLSEFHMLCERRLGVSVALLSPYKICDLKALYGEIFREQLEGYDFWGFSDLDMIYGQLSDHITPDVFEKYDKILTQGSLSLFRNTAEMRELYKHSGPNVAMNWRSVLADPVNCIFDESDAIRSRLRDKGIGYFIADFVGEVNPLFRQLHLSSHEELNVSNACHQILLWKDGRTFRARVEAGAVVLDEFSHFHLQKRRMKDLAFSVDKSLGCFVIAPDRFILHPEGIPDVAHWHSLNPSSSLSDWGGKLYRPVKSIRRRSREYWLRQKYLRGKDS